MISTEFRWDSKVYPRFIENNSIEKILIEFQQKLYRSYTEVISQKNLY
ncbi:hypothetical protein TUMEXPCC7403_03360 [Tumidithrix helvetica PCC 7403]